MDALKNRNSSTSIRTNGFSNETYQFPQTWRSIAHNTAQDLKSAADTVLATFLVPRQYGAVQILAMGYHLSASGGAVTTSGTMKLTIGGVDVEDVNNNPIETTDLIASLPAYSPVEVSLNRTTRETNLQAVPDLPYAVADELIQLRVATQGSGAGAQTVWPYLIVRVHPKNADLWGALDD